MFKNRLRRYTGLIGLISLLVAFIIVVIIGNRYLDTNIIQRDYFSASRIEVLDQTLNRIGPQDAQLRKDILDHVHLLRDGGELVSLYGPSWYKPAITDERILAAISDIDAAAEAGDDQAFKEAYHNFSKVSATADFEARKRVEILQYLIVGIILIGFIAILSLLIFRLGRSDDKAINVESENSQILSAIDDGLFLIDRNYRIGEQKSDAVARLFGSAETVSGNFFDAMYGLISKENLDMAREFIDLLFEGRVLQDLVQDVNPLQEIEVEVVNSAGGQVRKFLNFNFSRDERSESNDIILVSVSDATKEVKLRRELESTKELQKERMNLFVGLLRVSPEKLIGFCDSSLDEMREINAVLANEDLEDSSMRSKLEDIFRRAHRVKGDASALGLSLFESSMHRFETKIESLQKLMRIDGRNILELTVQLKDMIAETEMIRNIAPKVEALVGVTPDLEASAEAVQAKAAEAQDEQAPEMIGVLTDLQALVNVVSERQGKKVVLDAHGLEILDDQSEFSKSVRSLCVQLVRNSVVHGVETPLQRAATNKSPLGLVGVSVHQTEENCLQLVVRDDGQGLQYDAIRARAIQAGLLTPEQAHGIQDTALLKYIFMPGFSSVTDVGIDAGRGVGLDFVRTEMKRLGGKLSVSSRAGDFTKFVLTLPIAV